MKFNYLTLASLLTVGTLCISSCSKDEEINRDENVLEVAQTVSEYDDFVAQIAQDTNVIEYAVVNPNQMLRRQSDRYETYIKGYGPYYVYDLAGWASKSKNAPDEVLHNGRLYFKIDVDLNMDAKGDYVYLYYAATLNPNTAIGAIDAYYNTTNYKPGTTIAKYINRTGDLNCNSGTNGGFIRIGTRHVSKVAYEGLLVAAYKSKHNGKIFGGWERLASDMDLNKGAGGRYIYIFAKRADKKF